MDEPCLFVQISSFFFSLPVLLGLLVRVLLMNCVVLCLIGNLEFDGYHRIFRFLRHLKVWRMKLLPLCESCIGASNICCR